MPVCDEQMLQLKSEQATLLAALEAAQQAAQQTANNNHNNNNIDFDEYSDNESVTEYEDSRDRRGSISSRKVDVM